MGCVLENMSITDIEKTLDLTSQELVMRSTEQQLPFTYKNSKVIIMGLRSESSGDTISLSQLRRAFRELEIEVEPLSDPDSAFYRTIKLLKTQKKLYNMRLMSIAAILLGKGSLQEKATWLFKQYDADAQGTLDADEIKYMVNDLFNVSCEILPQVSKACGKVEPEQIQQYLEPVLENREKVVDELCKLISTQQDVSEEEFVKRMANKEERCWKLLWSVSFRSLCTTLTN